MDHHEPTRPVHQSSISHPTFEWDLVFQQLEKLKLKNISLEQSSIMRTTKIRSLQALVREESEMTDNLIEIADRRQDIITRLKKRIEMLERRNEIAELEKSNLLHRIGEIEGCAEGHPSRRIHGKQGVR